MSCKDGKTLISESVRHYKSCGNLSYLGIAPIGTTEEVWSLVPSMSSRTSAY